MLRGPPYTVTMHCLECESLGCYDICAGAIHKVQLITGIIVWPLSKETASSHFVEGRREFAAKLTENFSHNSDPGLVDQAERRLKIMVSAESLTGSFRKEQPEGPP